MNFLRRLLAPPPPPPPPDAPELPPSFEPLVLLQIWASLPRHLETAVEDSSAASVLMVGDVIATLERGGIKGTTGGPLSADAEACTFVAQATMAGLGMVMRLSAEAALEAQAAHPGELPPQTGRRVHDFLLERKLFPPELATNQVMSVMLVVTLTTALLDSRRRFEGCDEDWLDERFPRVRRVSSS